MTRAQRVLHDVAISSAAGLVATKPMEVVTTKIQRVQSEEATIREQQASPGLASEVAARKAAQRAGVHLDERQVQRAGQVLHYSLAMAWGPLYPVLRRRLGLSPLSAGLGTGLAMFLIADEGFNSLSGTSAPPRAYPLVTHVRGLAGHVVFGLVLAAVTEAAWRLTGACRERPL
ncbi:MAG: DUF1440 domain-containing protein [Actinomycetota bacterium]|jgi:hypothetical protein